VIPIGYVEHLTRDGERWDQIADRYYGDPYGYEVLIQANPTVAIIPCLDAGLKLLIPVFEDTPAMSAADLPPWKRELAAT
jgi:phage tail protein X